MHCLIIVVVHPVLIVGVNALRCELQGQVSPYCWGRNGELLEFDSILLEVALQNLEAVVVRSKGYTLTIWLKQMRDLFGLSVYFSDKSKQRTVGSNSFVAVQIVDDAIALRST